MQGVTQRLDSFGTAADKTLATGLRAQEAMALMRPAWRSAVQRKDLARVS